MTILMFISIKFLYKNIINQQNNIDFTKIQLYKKHVTIQITYINIDSEKGRQQDFLFLKKFSSISKFSAKHASEPVHIAPHFSMHQCNFSF